MGINTRQRPPAKHQIPAIEKPIMPCIIVPNPKASPMVNRTFFAGLHPVLVCESGIRVKANSGFLPAHADFFTRHKDALKGTEPVIGSQDRLSVKRLQLASSNPWKS